MYHATVSWEIPIKVQNFRLSTAHKKCHQICTLIGSFCRKYIKFQPKQYRGFMAHDTEERCKFQGKTNFLFLKWQEFREFWTENSKFSKFLIFFFCAKHLTFDQKVERIYLTWHWRVIKSLTIMVWREEFCKFSLEYLIVSKLGLWWDPLVQSRKCMS